MPTNFAQETYAYDVEIGVRFVYRTTLGSENANDYISVTSPNMEPLEQLLFF
jgi:hypothetical protein